MLIRLDHSCLQQIKDKSVKITKKLIINENHLLDEIKQENNQKVMENIRRKLAILSTASNIAKDNHRL